MERKNFSALFLVVMILMLIPFLPAFIENALASHDVFAVPTTYAATHSTTEVADFISTGYVGQYGPNQMPVATDNFSPRVLGIASQRDNSPPPLYQAQEVGRSNSVLNLNSGQAVTVWVDFLNTGQSTWYNYGDNFVALNVANPTGRTSPFQHEFWNEYNYRPARLLQSQVNPGETGRFRFALQAPAATGIYLEEFHLVAENLTWIDGGYTSFNIGVGETVDRPPDYQAQEVERMQGGVIEVDPGVQMTFWVNFENTGLRTWYNDNDHFIAMNVTCPVARVSSFKHNYWNEYYYRPARLLQSRIYPGEIGTFKFALQIPNVEGYYTEKFSLVSENLVWLPGSEITIEFKVGDPQSEEVDYTIVNEPTVRIGLLNTKEVVQITADGGYNLINMNTNVSEAQPADAITEIEYSADAYWRIVPASSDTIIEVTSFENKPLWNSDLNDNTFRGVIEVRYSEETGEMWVINELGIESYLKGLAEVSNEQPEEYLKSLITAARSYVLWHKLNGGRHADNFYDINATTDQVYKGYGFEQRSIDPVLAVQNTIGIVITHPDAVTDINPQGIAIAAYSSGTDGRTRTWNEVWAGSGFPWLVSVTDPYGVLSNWNTLEGNHMVGMSAKGARGYATEEAKSYDWILQHYYTGVDVEKIY